MQHGSLDLVGTRCGTLSKFEDWGECRLANVRWIHQISKSQAVGAILLSGCRFPTCLSPIDIWSYELPSGDFFHCIPQALVYYISILTHFRNFYILLIDSMAYHSLVYCLISLSLCFLYLLLLLFSCFLPCSQIGYKQLFQIPYILLGFALC